MRFFFFFFFYINFKKETGAVLDVEKAFSQVWHEGLLQKLRSLSVPYGLYNVLNLYLNSRVFSVRVGDTQSPLRSLSAWAPQESLLSPLLPAVSISEVPLPLNPHSTPIIRPFTIVEVLRLAMQASTALS
jgi:hypothetical protein